MDIKSDHQYQEYYDDWISRILQYIATTQYFFTGFTQAVKVLLKKGLILAWKEIRATISKFSKTDFFLAGINITVGLFGLIILLAGISLLGYQAILWLQTGVWTKYPLLIIFNFLFENTFLHQWIIGPESWIGMQQLSVWFLESTPIWLALIVPGLSIAISASGIFFIALTIRFYQLKSF
tara:strand:+ start:2551 stop:3090 length:540 start_codon:yes stop_codon:yes gene_type:complete